MEGKLYLQAEKSYPLKTALLVLGFRNHPNLQNIKSFPLFETGRA
jgi:hypothetical protein